MCFAVGICAGTIRVHDWHCKSLRSISIRFGGWHMQIHRRQFLKYCLGSAAALGLPITLIGRLEGALAADRDALPKVIWLNGASCSGCTVSLANLFGDTGPTDIADLLFNTIDLVFHPTLMSAAGDLAVQQIYKAIEGRYILVVEGGIPTAFGGNTCLLWSEGGRDVTAMEAVKMLAPHAAAILSIGTCASYGGIPAAGSNPTGIVSVAELAGVRTVNIPGCPTHPDWIVWTMAHLLTGESLQLDSLNRPKALFQRSVHERCPRKGQDEAKTFGIADGCLKALGCKGSETRSDCPSRKWNGGTNWCIGAGGVCIGCTEKGFPDKFSPFYKLEYGYAAYEKPVAQEPTPGDTSPHPQIDPQPEPSTGSLSILKAEWQKSRDRLTVLGKGEIGAIVIVSDATTGVQFGAVSVNSQGTWRFRRKNLKSVPKRVQADSVQQFAVAEVIKRS